MYSNKQKFLVSTTTHDSTGSKIDSWRGEYIEAASQDDAIEKQAEYEIEMLKTETDATDIEQDGAVIWYTLDGQQQHIKVSCDGMKARDKNQIVKAGGDLLAKLNRETAEKLHDMELSDRAMDIIAATDGGLMYELFGDMTETDIEQMIEDDPDWGVE